MLLEAVKNRKKPLFENQPASRMVGGKKSDNFDGGTPNVTVLKGASTCFIKPKPTHTGSN